MYSNLIYHEVSYDSDSMDFERFEKLGQALPTNSQKWAPKRKRDYLAGRFCAKKCLSTFDLESFEIASNEDRSPIWPRGYCGSITHTKTYACAVVASLDVYRSVGIDSEQIMKESTFDRVKRQIATDTELDIVSQVSKQPRIALTIIFSAKEAVFKAVYPLVKKHFYFEAFEITDITDSYVLGRFVANLNNEFKINTSLKITYKVSDDRVDSLVTIKNR